MHSLPIKFGELHIHDLGQSVQGRSLFRLDQPLDYRIRVFGEGHAIFGTVPTGFTTDFASVPRLFWRLIPASGPHNRAAVLHDYLYRRKAPRFLADVIFYEALKSLGLPLWKCLAMYYAVRAAGWTAYRNM